MSATPKTRTEQSEAATKRDKEDTTVAYELLPSKDEGSLFFRLDGETALRCGAIGYMRLDFGKSGKEFRTTWFDGLKHLKTHEFKTEFNEVVDSLRNDGDRPPFASRENLAAFCAKTPGKELTVRGGGYTVRTLDRSYCFCCRPAQGDYDIYCFCYDNRCLLPELAGKHDLPDICYSVEPSTGDLILLKAGERGYYRCEYSADDPKYNLAFAAERNTKLGVTRAQEEAMLAGSIFGFDVPAAKPWNYEPDGTPRKQPAKDRNREYER
jgi:hypothetical protein